MQYLAVLRAPVGVVGVDGVDVPVPVDDFGRSRPVAHFNLMNAIVAFSHVIVGAVIIGADDTITPDQE